MAVSQPSPLLDHLVGTGEDRRRNRDSLEKGKPVLSIQDGLIRRGKLRTLDSQSLFHQRNIMAEPDEAAYGPAHYVTSLSGFGACL
jgi:hypothetical protein